MKTHTAYVFEALLAVNPNSHEWSRVAFHAINGWQDWRDHPNLLRDGIHHHQYANSLAFADEETAIKAYSDLSLRRQKYPLRVARVVQTIDHLVVCQ